MKHQLYPFTVFLLDELRHKESRAVNLWKITNLHIGVLKILEDTKLYVLIYSQPRSHWGTNSQGDNHTTLGSLMPCNQYVRAGIFRINSCKSIVDKWEKEAFAPFFGTEKKMQYCMMFKPVMKHSNTDIFIYPKCVSNYGKYLPIFMEKMITIWTCGTVPLSNSNGLKVQCSKRLRSTDITKLSNIDQEILVKG